MATNLEIITDALREINVIAETDTASAEQGDYCLQKLNDLMESEEELELGYFAQTSTTDDCPIPNWAHRAVKVKLASVIASHYGASISPELAVEIGDAWGMVIRKAMVDQVKPMDQSQMPIGTGHYGIGWDITR